MGVHTVAELLEAGATPEGRKKLEGSTGTYHKLILEWVNIARASA